MNSMNLGNTIRIKRLQLKMTQEQVAVRLGVTAPAVHKWEHGISYPDISLLPALARLLETDLNELLSFDENISDQELAAITSEAMGIMKDGRYAEAFASLERKVRQYPRDPRLLVQCGAVADGGLKLFGQEIGEERKRYEEKIIEWYREAVSNGSGQFREMALYMLSVMYSSQGRYEEAQQTLEQLSESPYDKQVLKADIARRRGCLDEALKTMQTRLFKNLTDAISSLTLLMGFYEESGDASMQQIAADHVRQITEQFHLWDYNLAVMDFKEGMLEKSKEKTLEAVRRLLSCLETPFDPGEYPLFAMADLGEPKMKSFIMPAIHKLLTNEKGLDESGFLNGDPDLLKLLDQFGRKEEGV